MSSGGGNERPPSGGNGAVQLEMPDGSTAGVMSLRRPLVERLRMTAAAMEEVSAVEDVAQLVASNLFGNGSGGGDAAENEGGGISGSEAAAELRELILAIQDVTAERDEARASLAKLTKQQAEGGEAEELKRLRAENAKLRGENANMFTLMEENESLRTALEQAKLELTMAGGGEENIS